MGRLAPYPGTPRWVKRSGIASAVLALLAAVVLLKGIGDLHGPARHASPGAAGGHTVWGPLALLGVLVVASVALNWGWLVDLGIVPRLGRSSIVGRLSRWPNAARAPMTMPSGLRKFVLTVHVASSVGSLGSVAIFLALSVAGLTSQDAHMVPAAYLAMDFIARVIIVPLLLAALLIGLVQTLATPWSLFQHYWVLTKFLLTVLTIIVLLQQMEGISYVARVAAETTLSSADLLGLRRSLTTHATGGLLVLLLLVALSIYKPRGLTRYGWRKQHGQGA
jgi:hypothetical protein